MWTISQFALRVVSYMLLLGFADAMHYKYYFWAIVLGVLGGAVETIYRDSIKHSK